MSKLHASTHRESGASESTNDHQVTAYYASGERRDTQCAQRSEVVERVRELAADRSVLAVTHTRVSDDVVETWTRVRGALRFLSKRCGSLMAMFCPSCVEWTLEVIDERTTKLCGCSHLDDVESKSA